jgi:hypothetical protein
MMVVRIDLDFRLGKFVIFERYKIVFGRYEYLSGDRA